MAFLADPKGLARWISDTDALDGHAVAHIISEADFHTLSNGYQQWERSQEVSLGSIDPPAGYRPWQHSPLATTDRLLPVEPLQDILARTIYGKPYSDLPEGDDETERGRVLMTAIGCLLNVQLDRDGQGAVPILEVAHSTDEPGETLRWRIAFATGVRGLYLRVIGNGWFGEEWGIVTGSGWRVASGWHDRAEASAAVDALGRVLPNTDWMLLTPAGFTDRAKAAIRAVLARHRPFGLDADVPEPDVMPDVVPARDPEPEPPAAGPAAT